MLTGDGRLGTGPPPCRAPGGCWCAPGQWRSRPAAGWRQRGRERDAAEERRGDRPKLGKMKMRALGRGFRRIPSIGSGFLLYKQGVLGGRCLGSAHMPHAAKKPSKSLSACDRPKTRSVWRHFDFPLQGKARRSRYPYCGSVYIFFWQGKEA